jgi:putative transposase
VLQRQVELERYTSWAFGRRLRTAGLLGSMGSSGDCYDNSLVESFFGSMQLELLDRQPWTTRQEVANSIFEWIEAWYNPRRRHSALGWQSPIEFENNPPMRQPTLHIPVQATGG